MPPFQSRRRVDRRILSRIFIALAGLSTAALACSDDSRIIIEFDGDTPILIFDQPSLTWGAPPVRVSELAIADESEAYWEIRAAHPDGAPIGGTEITYGRLPPGFEQIFPANGGRAKDITAGVAYYVGATGPNEITWRAIFALPVGRFGMPPKPEFGADETPAKIDLSAPQPDARIAD